MIREDFIFVQNLFSNDHIWGAFPEYFKGDGDAFAAGKSPIGVCLPQRLLVASIREL